MKKTITKLEEKINKIDNEYNKLYLFVENELKKIHTEGLTLFR